MIIVSCKNSELDKVEKIIFDTDMGSDCDDVGALALLNVYADEGKVEILGCIYSSGKIPYGVGVIDAINTWFGRPDIPIGADYETKIGDPKDKMNAFILANQTELFGHKQIQTSDVLEQTKLNRKILSKQPDNSVTYLTVGHTNALYELLISEPDEISTLSGKKLIQKKVKRWVVMGALEANNKDGRYTQDWNLYKNGTAPSTEFLVKNFPKPVYFIATGSDVMTGKSLLQTPENNIVRSAYEEWLWNTQKKQLTDQRPSWDIIAVMYAIEGVGDYLFEEEPGYLDFSAQKGAHWIRESNNKQHRFILTRENKKTDLEDYLNTRIAKQPQYKP
jgi:inosine-uridine nucleoside N-ribohydrolase